MPDSFASLLLFTITEQCLTFKMFKKDDLLNGPAILEATWDKPAMSLHLFRWVMQDILKCPVAEDCRKMYNGLTLNSSFADEWKGLRPMLRPIPKHIGV